MNAPSEIARDMRARLEAIVGPRGLITAPDEIAPYLVDWRALYEGSALAVVRPASTVEVAAVVKLCAETETPMVPQGGNTGMCGAATPDASGNGVVVNLGRMNKIIEVNALNNTMTVEAGCILANVQQAAADADRLFPLSLGGEGSCVIGGNISTNAGGINVLRYGNTRDLVLGIEAVLPDGRVWDGLRGLRKDNTGYDLKQLFIGAEGTLGIITAAVLKLFPAPRSRVTAWVALPEIQAAIDLIGIVRDVAGDRLTGFEIMSRQSVDFVLRHSPAARDTFADRHPWYALVELSDSLPVAGLDEVIESALESAVQRDLVVDAVVASSAAQAAARWATAGRHLGGAESRRPQPETRHHRPHQQHPRFCATHRPRARGGCPGHPNRDVWPRRRRQPALQPQQAAWVRR